MEIIKILTWERKNGRTHGTVGSSIIRGDWLIKHWDEASLWSEGAKSDVMIFEKVYWEEMMDAYPGIKILDLVDPDFLTGALELVKISQKVDAITCSSKGLYDYVKKVVKCPVKHIPDRLDLEFFNYKKEHSGKATNVVWFGYHNNAKDVLPMILPTLANLGLSLTVVSNQDYVNLNSCGVEIINKQFNWDTIKFDLTYGDIVLNPQPIERNKRFIYKSENKTWIAWACGMPVANTLEELELFLDPDQRKIEVEEKLKFIKEECDIKKSVKDFKNLIKLCQENRKKSQSK